MLSAMKTQPKVRLIDNKDELAAFCEQLRDARWLAVDTEFLRERTYYSAFCLLQVASSEHAACIDPIAITDLDPMLELLYDPDVTKVFHSGRQDLEIFYNLTGRIPEPLFDTQIAAPLLGLSEQVGYADFIREILGVSLKKSHTRTDWSRRPLSSEQLQYALDDVVYLARAYPQICSRLEQLERLEWLEDDFVSILNPELYELPPENAWLRIKAGRKLNGESLSILQHLAKWREQTARERNMPRSWLLKDEALISIARLKPVDPEQLRILRGIHEKTLRKEGRAICEQIRMAIQSRPAKSNLPRDNIPRSEQQDALVNFLSGIVHQRALEHSVNPAYLAAKKDLELLVADQSDVRLLKGWRKSLIGDELCAILRGEKVLSIIDGTLQVDSRTP